MSPTSFANQGQSDPQAEAMKQDFENARDGFTPDAKQAGDVEHPETPSLDLEPTMDPEFQKMIDQENAKLDLSMSDEISLDKGQDFDFGR